jgi:hypothetical protein
VNKRLAGILGLIFILSASWFGGGQVAATPNASTLVINEVYAPSAASPQIQFFELYNGGTSTVDLSGYTIYNSGGSDRLNVLTQPLLGPGQTVAIGATAFPDQKIGSGLVPTPGDFLALVFNGPQDQTIDQVNWGTVNPNWPNYLQFQPFWNNAPAMPTDTTRSLQRYPQGYDTDQPTDWVQLPVSAGNPPPTYTPTSTALPVTATSTSTSTPVTATPTPVVGCPDRYEPDNLPTQAKPLDLETEQTHTICKDTAPDHAGDEDWFIISVVADKVYTLYTKDLGGGLDTILAVYTFPYDGTKIGENDDAPGCLCSQLDMTFPTAGQYYVRVRDNRRLGGVNWVYTVGFHAAGGPAPTVTPTATATVNPLAPTATSTPGVCGDAYEPDGVGDTAHLLLIGEIQPGHTFCPGGDADWYRFFGGRGKAYTIQTYNLGIGVDTYLYLFDSDGHTVMAENDDAPAAAPGGGPNEAVASLLDFFPIRDDFYFIMVKNKGDLGSPSMTYNVSLRVRANVPFPVGSPSPIIAPIVTVPSGPPATIPGFPTSPPAATAPPVATAPPTATRPPPGLPTAPPTAISAPLPQKPTEPPTPVPVTSTPVIETPGPGEVPTVESVLPLPATGHAADVAASIAMPVQVYMDRNRNGRADKGESVYGLRLIFTGADGQPIAGATTRAAGSAALLPRGARVRVQIPYLQWSGAVTVDAGGLMVRLPRPTLPQRIP